MIICDWCGKWNYIARKCMARGPEFHSPTIFHSIAQYNSKNGPTPKVASVDWKPNPPISQHSHQHALSPAIPDTNCTEPSAIYQQLYLSNLLSSLYLNYYPLHESPQGPTPRSPCATHDNDDYIKTDLPPESITPHITVFYNGYANYVPVSQSSFKKIRFHSPLTMTRSSLQMTSGWCHIDSGVNF